MTMSLMPYLKHMVEGPHVPCQLLLSLTQDDDVVQRLTYIMSGPALLGQQGLGNPCISALLAGPAAQVNG